MKLKHLLGIYMCQYANYMDNITRVYVMLMLLDHSFITRKDNRLVLKSVERYVVQYVLVNNIKVLLWWKTF